MLPFIPLVVAITMMVSYVSMMQASPSRQATAEVISENMKIFHAAGVRAALRGDGAAGRVESGSPAPFADMGEWTTSIFVDGERSLVATWSSSDGLPSMEPRSTADPERIRAVMRLEREIRRWPYPSRAGRLLIDGNAEFVGDMDVSRYDMPLVEGAPVLVTLIR
jgi:hypothetical protein